MKGIGCRRAAAFEDVDIKRAAAAAQLQAQRRRRRLTGMAGASRELQAMHGSRLDVVAPADDCCRRIAAQGLLGGPLCIQFALSTCCHIDDDEAFERNTCRVPCSGLQTKGWRNHDQPADAQAGLSERCLQQPDFTESVAVAEQFGQRTTRPASAGKFGIQRRKATSNRR